MNEQTRWHQHFGNLLQLLLTPRGIQVQTEVAIMSDTPRVDVLLLRRNEPQWTEAQRAVLPDDIRDSSASHILIEFKYTESLSAEAVLKTAAYDLFYKQAHRLNGDDVQTYLLCAKKPQAATRQRLRFTTERSTGVYENDSPFVHRVRLVSLNELPPTAYNAFVQLFATQKKARLRAIHTLRDAEETLQPDEMTHYLVSMLRQVYPRQLGAYIMEPEMTKEDMIEMSEAVVDFILHVTPKEKLLKYLQVDERLAGLRPEERLSGLRPEERLAGLRPEERLAGLRPEERLAGMSVNEIERYLRQLKEQNNDTN